MSKITQLEEQIATVENRINAILHDEAVASQQCDEAREAIATGNGEPRALAASIAEAESVCATLNKAEAMVSGQLRELEALLATENANVDAARHSARLDELAREMDALRAKDGALWETARAALAQSVTDILDLRDEAALVQSERRALNSQAGKKINDPTFVIPLNHELPGAFGVVHAVERETNARERLAQSQRYEAARLRRANVPQINGGNVVGVSQPSRDEMRDRAETDYQDEREYQQIKEAQTA